MLVLFTLAAGMAAGGLGALLGLGGGVILVPLLNAIMGLPFREAAGVSLIGILATSSSVAASSMGRQLLNPRLGIVLLVFSVGGATIGAATLHLLSETASERIFGITAALVALVIVSRLDKRNVLSKTTLEEGALGGHFFDEDTRTEVTYRVRRLPLAAGSSFAAGLLASFVGAGGGILIVPALNAWCGVPIRVAAATSAFMIGITAVPGAVAHWAGGHLGAFELSSAAAFGVIGGYRLGQWLGARAPVRSLKLLMAGLLTVVAVQYLVFR